MRKDIDMLHGPLGPAIVRFTIPVILTTLLQTLSHQLAFDHHSGSTAVFYFLKKKRCAAILTKV